MNRIFILFIASASLLVSCRSTKKIQTAIAIKKDTTVVAPLPPVNHSHEDSISFIRQNYAGIQHNRIDYTNFSAKIDVDYEDADGKKYSVTAHLRMYKDSVIWVSITALLGIEGLRAYITRDSVKIIDKQNKTYSPRSVAYLRDVIDLPLGLSSLQDLLVGNPVFLDSNIVSYTKAPGSVTLLSLGEFFKNLLTIGESDKLLQSSKLMDPDEMKSRSCMLVYSDYEKSDKGYFPTKRNITVSEKKRVDIRLNFKQYDFNETLSFPFSVPKNYKPN